jgi:PKD repeat protein
MTFGYFAHKLPSVGALGACRFAFCLLLGATCSLRLSGADFAVPRRVTDGSGKATQAAIGLDSVNNAYIATVVDERIVVKIIGPSMDEEVPIPESGLGQGDPDFATSYGFATYLSFSQINEESIEEGREIYVTNNRGGGGFKTPVNVSRSRVDDSASRLVLDMTGNGGPHIAWVRRLGEQSQVMYWNEGLPASEPVMVAAGDFPTLYADKQKVAHLVYSRDNDLFYINNAEGSFKNELQVTTTSEKAESSASIGVAPDGRVLVSYESGNALYFASKIADGWRFSTRLVDTEGVFDPRMRVRGEGQVTLVYAKNGELFYVLGQSSSLNAPRQIVIPGSSGVKSRPGLELDRWSNIHLSYIENGEVYYTNNAAEPTAEFSGVPSIGEVPLTVKFEDLSSGDIQIWEWDFGDGETSRLKSPTHTYATPGKYTVKLRVVTAGAMETTRERPDYIFVQDPFNTLRLPDQVAFPNQRDVWFPVLACHKEPIQAFQLMGRYDPNILVLKDYSLNFTATQATIPFLVFNDLMKPNPERPDLLPQPYFEVGCIFDVDEFKGEPTIPSGCQSIFKLIFDVSRLAPQGGTTVIEFVNDYDVSPVLNIFTVGGFTRIPALTHSTVTILPLKPPFPAFFKRGDVDGNQRIELTDPIKILNFLFIGGETLKCMDAADVADTGTVGISSAIYLLNFLFLGGPPPAVPFPEPGIDPTVDGLKPPCPIE